ncbi:MAG: hypothetical protein R3C30_00985 [Hyphomonadaceae bacterium]
MRLFPSQRDGGLPEPEEAIILLWRYEVSDDGGKTWRPEAERADDECYVLRRGTWVAPAPN